MARKCMFAATFGFSSAAGGGVPSPTVLLRAPADCPRTLQRWRRILCWWKIDPAALKPGSSVHQLRIPSISPSPPERICRKKKTNKKKECSSPKHSSTAPMTLSVFFLHGLFPLYFYLFYFFQAITAAAKAPQYKSPLRRGNI